MTKINIINFNIKSIKDDFIFLYVRITGNHC